MTNSNCEWFLRSKSLFVKLPSLLVNDVYETLRLLKFTATTVAHLFETAVKQLRESMLKTKE